MTEYNHKKIEKKWQKKWAENNFYHTDDFSPKPKCFVLDMFPYPSGEGLHVGHPKGYIATDIYSRMKTMQGFNVLHPMGFDAFGLPAENYALKNKVHPKEAVDRNIARYKEQLAVIGFNYDWAREINTTDPSYYKWTQWIFLQLFKKGLAYESNEPINWCPSCQTGLANEDLEDGRCERCGSEIEKRPMRQWVLKITDYADRLLKDLDLLDWPKHIKESQKNWIGRGEGALIKFEVKDPEIKEVAVFTTRPDTIFGVTFLAVAPEMITKWLEAGWSGGEEVLNYARKIQVEKIKQTYREVPEKTGLDTGLKAINPGNGKEIPIWVTNYVLNDVGTGVVMAVPAHDERDLEFAQKNNLPQEEVVISDKKNEGAYLGDGVLKNSGQFDGQNNRDATPKILDFIGGKKTTTYKLKDWVFSRQRYWGEPIPIIHCAKCGAVAVPEKDLPVELPEVEHYEPTGTGESPLVNITDWVNTTCPTCGGEAKRETNTMPQWAGSSWYYLRFMDPKNDQVLVDPKKEKYWAPVDVYVGGTEHATRHLIYARFWHKFLFDQGVVSTPEPFARIGKSLGLILGEDGKKMSKRFGNVVNPDEIVLLYGADTLRLYEMFMGPFEGEIAWKTDSIIGSRRFVEKIWRLQDKVKAKGAENGTDLESLLHQTIKKVGEDIESFSFNTAVSTLMIFVNRLDREESLSFEIYKTLLLLLAPFIPHVVEEIWSNLNFGGNSIFEVSWPTYDQNKLNSETVTMVIQINGKVKAEFEIKINSTDEEVLSKAKTLPQVEQLLVGKVIKKEIIIKNRLVSLVIN